MTQSGHHWQNYEREQRAKLAQRSPRHAGKTCADCGEPMVRGSHASRCIECSQSVMQDLRLKMRRTTRAKQGAPRRFVALANEIATQLMQECADGLIPRVSMADIKRAIGQHPRAASFSAAASVALEGTVIECVTAMADQSAGSAP